MECVDSPFDECTVLLFYLGRPIVIVQLTTNARYIWEDGGKTTDVRTVSTFRVLDSGEKIIGTRQILQDDFFRKEDHKVSIQSNKSSKEMQR